MNIKMTRHSSSISCSEEDSVFGAFQPWLVVLREVRSLIAALESAIIVRNTDVLRAACQKYLIAGCFCPLSPESGLDPKYSHIRISSPRLGKKRNKLRA